MYPPGSAMALTIGESSKVNVHGRLGRSDEADSSLPIRSTSRFSSGFSVYTPNCLMIS
jgi:hypothetical protein